MSKTRFAKAMSALAEYYGKELSEGVISLYWQGLEGYDIADIEAAIGRHLQNPDSGQWMPKIADIVRMIEGSTQTSAAIAWAKVMRAVGRVGQYRSVAFDDPVIHLALDDLGGWPAMCQISEDELPFLQNRFERIYRGYKVRGSDLPPYLPWLAGISERQNLAKGYQVEPPRLVGDLTRAKAVVSAGTQDGQRFPVHAGDCLPGFEDRLRLVGREAA